MTAQDIYLSPKQILSYLMDFEQKLPEPHKDFFMPRLNRTPISINELNEEAKRMMDYIGLTTYVPKCSFCQLKEGVGGNTRCCNPNIEVEINVSTNYRNNVEQTVAVLAHEICHKYLYVHGLYNPIEVVNEIFTDLCTMYVGFGNIIVSGYVTEKRYENRTDKYVQTRVNTEYLGYLEFPIYRRTLNIIRLVLWGENAADVLANENDPLLQDAFKRWISESDKKLLSRNVLINSGKESARLTKNMFILERLIYLINASQLDNLKLAENQLYNEDWFNPSGQIWPKNRFAVFNSIYQSTILESKSNDNKTIKYINRYISHLIMLVYDSAHLKAPDLLKISDFRCPFCGERHNSVKFLNKTALIRCPNCKKRFFLDCEQFDLMNTRNDFDHFKDELIKPIRKGYIDALENEKKRAYQIGYAEGKVFKEKELKNTISKLPFWLRWLIGKRLD